MKIKDNLIINQLNQMQINSYYNRIQITIIRILLDQQMISILIQPRKMEAEARNESIDRNK